MRSNQRERRRRKKERKKCGFVSISKFKKNTAEKKFWTANPCDKMKVSPIISNPKNFCFFILK